MPGKIRRMLRGLGQQFEVVHAVVECPHRLCQLLEYLFLDKLVETGLIEIVSLDAHLHDEVVEESGELQLVAPAMTGHLHALRTVDVQLMEASGQFLFVQYGIEEVELPSSSLLPKGR